MTQDSQNITDKPNPFEGIIGQSQVSRFLAGAHAEGRLSHAYLFVGPVGSSKTEMATALAKAKLCPSGGCNKCDTCIRIQRSTHPDVHWIEPQGAKGYMVEQIRELNADAAKAPIRANHKLYIISRAELLNAASANAFLKTLEEPLADTSFVLMARSRDGVLPTLVSRCQTLVFRKIPDDEAIELIKRQTGTDDQTAKIALSVSGGSTKAACEFVLSSAQKQIRSVAIEILETLPQMDAGDVIEAAKRIVEAIDLPTGEVKSKYAQEREKNEEFITKGALKHIDEQQKRAISSLKKKSLAEVFCVIKSWLRDCAVVAIGDSNLMINTDCHYTIELTAKNMRPQKSVDSQRAVDKASARIAHNVTPQLVLETMLFDIRKVLND